MVDCTDLRIDSSITIASSGFKTLQQAARTDSNI